jgi:hypothetical protein
VPNHFYPAPGKNFDAVPAAPASAPASTLLYSKPTFLKIAKDNMRGRAIFSSDFF